MFIDNLITQCQSWVTSDVNYLSIRKNGVKLSNHKKDGALNTLKKMLAVLNGEAFGFQELNLFSTTAHKLERKYADKYQKSRCAQRWDTVKSFFHIATELEKIHHLVENIDRLSEGHKCEIGGIEKFYRAAEVLTSSPKKREDWVQMGRALEMRLCACDDHKADRIELEHEMLDHLEKTFPPSNEPLNVLSIGSGEMLQDFILLHELLKKGYRHFNWECLEPECCAGQAQFDQYALELKNFGIQLNVTRPQTLAMIHRSRFKQDDKLKFHLAHAIDFNILTNVREPTQIKNQKQYKKLLKTSSRMHPKARLYLTFHSKKQVFEATAEKKFAKIEDQNL